MGTPDTKTATAVTAATATTATTATAVTVATQDKPLAQSEQQSVARYGDDRSLRLEIRTARRGLPGLATAPDDDVLALMIAAKFSGLNPYAGEIYMIPGKGVMTASKIKAADAVSAAARRGDHLAINFDPVYHSMELGAELGIEEGDVAYVCRIISSKARSRWYSDRLSIIAEMKMLGASRAEIEEKLSALLPAPPEYRAVGVVKAAENFGDAQKKVQVFTRQDRAKKRALIKCLNVNGLAAPDQRQYGGVQMAGDEPVDAQYTVRATTPAKTAAEVKAEIDPEWTAAVEEDHGGEPERETLL